MLRLTLALTLERNTLFSIATFTPSVSINVNTRINIKMDSGTIQKLQLDARCEQDLIHTGPCSNKTISHTVHLLREINHSRNRSHHVNSRSQSESPTNRWITVMGMRYLTPVGEGLNCQTEVSIILDDLRADVQYIFPALSLVLLGFIL